MSFLSPFFPSTKSRETALLLPLRDTVLLPSITLPVVAARPRSIAVTEAVALTSHQQLIIATLRPEATQQLDNQEGAEVERLEQLYPIATLANFQRMIRMPTGPIQLLVEGLERVRLTSLRLTATTYETEFERLPAVNLASALESGAALTTLKALTSAIQSLWQEVAALNPTFPEDILTILLSREDPSQLAYQSAMLLQQPIEVTQEVLQQNNLEALLHQILIALSHELEIQRLRSEILGATKKGIDQQQREFFLREQLKTIQSELGELEPEAQELDDLRSRLVQLQLPEAATRQAKRELARLERVGSNSAEGGVIRTYLDWLLEMPWNQTGQDNLDLDHARQILDTDHYGLNQVKDRIIEHLATFKLKQHAQTHTLSHSEPYTVGAVLCFAGPPGVGKTSLGRSIARALGRPFERISLGGLRDEAELRGHRRTYIGAMPGRIVQALHRAGVNNPVIMLDELDKVGMDYRGDPASVLLEILDPQQNSCFRDLYLDLDFDLAPVFFIATANDLNRISAPLLDRLEVVELSGYSDQEKVEIARTYLLPRQVEKAGLPPEAVQLSPKTLRLVIDRYTREAGVRRLEQQLGALCRKVAVQFASGKTEPVLIHPEQLDEVLGPTVFLPEELLKTPRSGVMTGLAWTPVGGDILFVEALQLPQGKELLLTGQLGEVMEESARIAYSYIWSHAEDLGVNPKQLCNNGLHIHVPAGAVPKDGPSAGVTIVTAIASLLTGRPTRTDTAITGEINLSGDILPIGGVREKIIAACRAGIKRVILPTLNQNNLVDLPPDVAGTIEYIFCDRIDQALEQALMPQTEGLTEKGNGSIEGGQSPAALTPNG